LFVDFCVKVLTKLCSLIERIVVSCMGCVPI